MQYPWKRFWCPHDGAYSLADDGYLYDPDSEYGKAVNPQLASLSEFEASPCIVLLGEPGIGKSTEFCSEVNRMVAIAAESGDACHSINLKEYQTDSLLVRDVFEHPVVSEWLNGSHVLHLFLDSLDEGRLEVRNIASILSGHLQRLEPYSDRLRIRIACRTAEWLPSLEDTLTSLWSSEGAVRVLELMPLRKVDVCVAAEANQIDCDQFFEEVSRVAAQAFAVNPISLSFLINIYLRSGTLPSTKNELYESGCRCLCDEFSQSRRDAGHFGQLTSAERLVVASRVAAMMVFSGKTVIDTSVSSDIGDEAVTVSEIAGGTESQGEDHVNVDETAIRDALSTTLFSGRGSQRLGFSHRTYGEFLAARYFTQRGLDQTQVVSLLFHPECDTRVVPQLAETTAWVAVKDDDVFKRMMEGDPQTLLRSDVATADAVTKTRLVARLLKGYQSGDLDDSDWGLRDHYYKLQHPGIADQLANTFRDKDELVVTRRFIADLAEECRVDELVDVLCEVALDGTDDTHIRVQAAHAIVRIGKDTSIERIKPLGLGVAGADPEDELRGSSLSGLWPRRMVTAQELFDSLIRPQRQSFSGAYRYFLQFELPGQLQLEDLVCGLRWCASQERARGHIDDFADAITEIVSRSVNHLGQPDILTAFAEYVISRMTQHDELALQSEQFHAISDEHRRALINAIVPRLDDIEKHSYALLARVPVIVRECDLGWLLEMSANASTLDEQTRWANLARQRILIGCQNGLDEVLHCCKSNSVVADAFSDLVQPVELDSERAKEMRARYARSLELEELEELEELSRAREEPPLLNPPPPERVEQCLRRFESGDLTGWWQVNRELQLEFRSTHYQHDLQDDLRELSVWNSANDDTRQRLVAAAKRYILEWKARPWEWLGRRKYHYPDFAGYRALVLIEQTDPEFLSSLNSERWANLAPAIIGFPTNSGIGSDSKVRQERLLAQAYALAPEAVINAMLTLIDHEDGENDRTHLFVLRRVKDCRDRRMGLALLQKARDRSLKATSVAELIEDAFDRDPTAAERLAMSLFLNGRAVDKSKCWPAASRRKRLSERCGRHARASVRRSRGGYRRGMRGDAANCHQRRARAREVARRLGVVIWLNSSDRWDTLWPHFESDWQFFRDVMSDVAHEHRQSRMPPADLTEDQLGELFTTLSQQFPQKDDPKHDGAHCVGPRESVQHYRDGVLSSLQSRGTTAAVQVVARVKNVLPHLTFLDWVQRAAHRTMLEATWRPTPVRQLRELIGRQRSRLVRSERELQKVVIESLARLQQRLHGENPSVRDIWDHARKDDLWTPVDENAFSDYLARHLREDLRGCGIVALREVEIRRGNNGSGERTDLYINAQMYGAEPDSWDSVRVIVEVKGCWHQEVKTAMESQLKNRYLRDNDCGHGIYVVGWFECDSWNTGDTRRGKTPKMSVAEAREFFAKQSSQVSDTNKFITSCVLDASLR